MDVVLSAVIGELASRLISFVIEKSRAHGSSSNDTRSRLQLLLLRAGTVVAEADRRRITNRGLLLQLEQLRDAMYRGYHMLDDGSGDGRQITSRPKRRSMLITRQEGKLRREMVDKLEATLDGMKEFLLILMHCPPITRQPYSAYLFMERCMFGRHVEKEQIAGFLLRPSSCLEVLPVTGPCYVGKTTLVEHVYMDDAVRRNFSHVLRLSGEDLSNIVVPPNGNGTTDEDDYRRKLGLSDINGRYLMIVELVQDADVVTWGKLYHHCLRRHAGAGGSKAILISRTDQVSSLGTEQAIRLTRLREQECRYFFRVLAFGSANPYDHHPDLESTGNEIATEIGWSFAMTRMIAKALSANMTKQFWRRVLWCVRKSMQAHILVFGEDPRHVGSRTPYLSYFYSFCNGARPLVLLSEERYKVRSMARQGDVARTKTPQEVLRAKDMKCGDKFDVINQAWIPPYTTLVIKVRVVEEPKGVYHLEGDKCLNNKRKRNHR